MTASPKSRRARAGRTAALAATAAALVVLAPAARAAGPLDQSQTALDGTHSYFAFSVQTFAQTFTAGRTGLLDQVTLPLRAYGGGALTVDVVPVGAGVPVAGATPLASATVPAAAAPRFGPVHWVAVPLADTLVTAGTQYAIALEPPAQPWVWLGASAPLYADGQAFFSFPPSPIGAWRPLSYSFGFQTFVVPCTSGTVEGGLTVAAGQTACLTGAQVHGPVTVKSGGNLVAGGSSMEGPVRATGAVSVRLCSSAVQGPVRVEQSTGPVVVGDGGGCGANTVDGPVSLEQDTGGVTLTGNVIHGPVSLSQDGGGVTVSANAISGPLSCADNLTPPDDAGQPNSVAGPATGECAGL